MNTTFTVRLAGPADVPALVELRTEAEAWLASRGIKQWTPDYGDYARSALAQFVADGVAWVICDADLIVATFSLNNEPDPDFWGWADDQDQALYLAKLIVRRSHAGKGIADAAMNWTSQRANVLGRRWLRIDVRRDNHALQQYYLDRGFEHVRTWHAPTRRTESGWLAQRPAGSVTPCGTELRT